MLGPVRCEEVGFLTQIEDNIAYPKTRQILGNVFKNLLFAANGVCDSVYGCKEVYSPHVTLLI